MKLPLSSETRQFIEEHLHDDVRELALQGKRYPDIDLRLVVTQIAGRQSIVHKVPSWYAKEGILYPARLSLEQCSSEVAASYKASLVKGRRLADLTGGFGVDCAFLSRSFGEADYVERQEELCSIAKNNFSVLGLKHITVHQEDAAVYLQQMPAVDCIFIDPARRNKYGGKAVSPADCEPDVEKLQGWLRDKAQVVLIKLSPMLDLSRSLQSVSHVCAVHVVSVHNECKELLLLMKNEPIAEEPPVHCINFAGNETQYFSFTREAEAMAGCTYAGEPGLFLYEPNASILKAGAYKSMASAYGVSKLHPNSHLYTSDVPIKAFPGRSFRVTGWSPAKEKTLTAGVKKANVSVRNFPLAAPELQKQLKLSDGGDVYLFATTLMNEKKVLIRCEKI